MVLISRIFTQKPFKAKLSVDRKSIEYKGATWARGMIYAQMGQYNKNYYDKSLRVWDHMKGLHNQDGEPFLRMGEIFMMTGKNSEAIYLLNLANGYDPYNAEVLRVRGSLFFLEGNYEQASSDFGLASKASSE